MPWTLKELHLHRPEAWKTAAFVQYPRCMNSTKAKHPPYLATGDPCIETLANELTHMGYSMRAAECGQEVRRVAGLGVFVCSSRE